MIASHHAIFVGPGKRHPNLRPSRESKRFRHHTDDGVRPRVYRDVASNDVGIGSEMVAPKLMTQQYNFVRSRSIFVRSKRPAQQRPRAQHRKELRSYCRSQNRFRPFSPSECEAAAAIRRHGFKRGALPLPIQIIGWRHRKPSQPGEALGRGNVPNLHQTRGIVERQGPKQCGIHNRENGCVRADSQRKHENRAQREAWAAPQRAKSVAKIGHPVKHRK